ncbi:MAG: bifunctional demethylmenaquinone methyltransferase/2-methoxy-6-polyprenyl-1,4-benzoquinol methylase UbiE [Phocaeicola sp.]|nr:bifunctional demethylmenaquinone methyltransferase/2-methoxy-6-polyprenyl-1,4-benzoquinol methylase UbiE [Phocaeicola sp.]
MDYPQEKIKPYSTEGKKSVQVEQMFDHIAPAYDRLNHTLSLHIDKYWRRKAIQMLKPFSPHRILDVATGTGDFAIQAAQLLQPEFLLGIDISDGMMQIGKEKVKEAGLEKIIHFLKDDCTQLSLTSNQFDAITVAFGIRNFEDLDAGLSEMYRVLKEAGHLVILELSEPQSFPMKQLYQVYSKVVIPTIGRIFSKDRKAYHYLPESIKAFPQGEVMKGIIRKAGFREVRFKRMTFGICTLYFATK